MSKYKVVWESDVEAETPHEAAEAALYILRDEESMQTVFRVYDGHLDEPLIVDATLPGDD
jgi:hypothetical protein